MHTFEEVAKSTRGELIDSILDIEHESYFGQLSVSSLSLENENFAEMIRLLDYQCDPIKNGEN